MLCLSFSPLAAGEVFLAKAAEAKTAGALHSSARPCLVGDLTSIFFPAMAFIPERRGRQDGMPLPFTSANGCSTRIMTPRTLNA